MNAGNLAGPLFVILGMLILRQRPRHAMGRLYFLVGVMLVVFSVANSGLVAGLPDEVRLVLSWYASWAWVVPVILVGTFGLLLLPDGRLPSPRWRWAASASLLAMLGFVLAMPYDDSVPAELRRSMPAWGEPVAEPAFLVGAVLALTMVPVCLVAPLVRMRRGGPGLRRQLGPVAVAGTTAIAITFLQDVLVQLLPVSHDIVLAAALGLFPVGVTVAVVWGGLFDIHRLVSRVVAYTIVLAVVVGCYLALVLALGTAARALTGGGSDLVVAISTLAVAALFQPLRRGVRDAVDRRFNRSRYDAARAADAFAAGLRDQVDLDAAASDLQRVVRQTLQPDRVHVWVGGGLR